MDWRPGRHSVGTRVDEPIADAGVPRLVVSGCFTQSPCQMVSSISREVTVSCDFAVLHLCRETFHFFPYPDFRVRECFAALLWAGSHGIKSLPIERTCISYFWLVGHVLCCERSTGYPPERSSRSVACACSGSDTHATTDACNECSRGLHAEEGGHP